MSENIEPVNLSSETQRRYLNYAYSVILSRALPDVRDGLKPVQRRILYAALQEDYRAAGRTRKCTGVIGEVTKSYHPHGDAPVYEALVRMAQPFSLRYPLIHGEGNFGSIDGDPPAAQRYTECRLMPIAEDMMVELDQNTVDFRPNFDGEKTEPIVLPAKFPQLLTNGVTGIAVGMATNIPPHNLKELIKACLVLLDNPDATTTRLVNTKTGPVRGPDFPLGGRIVADQNTLRQIYETGQGSIKVQGEWHVETMQDDSPRRKGSHPVIVITSIPYGVLKSNLLMEIGSIIEDRKLPMVQDMVDATSLENGLQIHLRLKEEADADAVMAYLYRNTQLQQNFNCNFTCLVPGGTSSEDLEPKRLGLRSILVEFLKFRRQTVRRRFEFDLAVLRRRIHILEGFEIIFNQLDKAIKLIRQSDGRADAAERLRKAFKLDVEQSLAIVDLNLYRIGKLEIDKIIAELTEKKQQAEAIEAILASEAKLTDVIRTELQQCADQFGDTRRTQFADETTLPEYDPETYIVAENTNVVLTRDGWLKRVGRLTSIQSTRVRDGDEVRAVVPGSTTACVLYFSSDGFVYTQRIDEVPASTGYGEPISKFFRIRDGVNIVGMLVADDRFTPLGDLVPTAADATGLTIRIEENGKTRGKSDANILTSAKTETGEWQILAVTKLGNVLRLPWGAFTTPSTKAGRRFVRLVDGDEVVFLSTPIFEEQTLFLVANDGHIIQFVVEEIPILAGVGKGVRGIRLANDAHCLGAHLPRHSTDGFQVENSRGTLIDMTPSKFNLTARGAKGTEVVKRGQIVRLVPPTIRLFDWSQLT